MIILHQYGWQVNTWAYCMLIGWKAHHFSREALAASWVRKPCASSGQPWNFSIMVSGSLIASRCLFGGHDKLPSAKMSMSTVSQSIESILVSQRGSPVSHSFWQEHLIQLSRSKCYEALLFSVPVREARGLCRLNGANMAVAGKTVKLYELAADDANRVKPTATVLCMIRAAAIYELCQSVICTENYVMPYQTAFSRRLANATVGLIIFLPCSAFLHTVGGPRWRVCTR